MWPSGQKQPSTSPLFSGICLLQGEGGGPRTLRPGTGSVREKGRGHGWHAGPVNCPGRPMESRLEAGVGEEYPRYLGPSFCPLLAAPRPFGHCLHRSHPPAGAHLESQELGCAGPHALYTFPGGQVRSGGTETGVRCAKEARAPSGCPRLTAQPASGVPPAAARATGTAKCRVGLQALAGRLRVATPAGVTDAGAEEQAGWDEAVAPGEDAVGRSSQRSAQRAVRWARAGPQPQDGPAPPRGDSLAQQQLTKGRGRARGSRGYSGQRGRGVGGSRGGPCWCPAALRDQPVLGHVLTGGGHGAVRPAAVISPVVGAGAWGVRGREGHPGDQAGLPATQAAGLSPPPSPHCSYWF